MEGVKKLALDNITQDNFDIILMTYKSLYDEGEMYDDWNPMRLRLNGYKINYNTHGVII